MATLVIKPIEITLPIRTVSEMNCRQHWRAKNKRKREQQMIVTAYLGQHERKADPLFITLTRLGPRTLDSDNLAASFKGIRDAVAMWAGIDDGELFWDCKQEKSKIYGVKIRIEF